VYKSSKIVLKRFFVLLLTREKVALGKLWTLETLKIREDPLLQIFPSMYHSRAQERVTLHYRFICSDDERLYQHGVITSGRKDSRFIAHQELSRIELT
jgi:hypothetical protein